MQYQRLAALDPDESGTAPPSEDAIIHAVKEVQHIHSESRRRTWIWTIAVTSLLLGCMLWIVFLLLPGNSTIMDTAILPSSEAPAILETTLASRRHFEIVNPSNDPAGPQRAYKSSPLTPPFWNITVPRPDDVSPGYLMTTSYSPSGPHHRKRPYILRQDGDLVFAPEMENEDKATSNFRVQQVDGAPHLTFWEGVISSPRHIGWGQGRVKVLDRSCRPRVISLENPSLQTAVDPRPNGTIDSHEQIITPWNTLLVSVYNITAYDLSSLGGPKDGWVTDSLFYELDIHTQEVLFSWAALDHVPITDSLIPSSVDTRGQKGGASWESPFDWFHINSIEVFDEEHFLINGRNTWSTYLISRADGHIVWEYNLETGGDFGQPPEDAKAYWTHDARVEHIDSHTIRLSYFDNHLAGFKEPDITGSGLVIQLSLPPNKSETPQLIQRVRLDDPKLFAEHSGNFQRNVSGTANSLLNFGKYPFAAELGPLPEAPIVWQAIFAAEWSIGIYRVFKGEWSSRCVDTVPSLVVETEMIVPPPEIADDSATTQPETEAGNIVGKSRRQETSSPQPRLQARCYMSWNGATDIHSWRVRVGGSDPAGELQSVGVADLQGFETLVEVDVYPGSCIAVEALSVGHEPARSNVVCV